MYISSVSSKGQVVIPKAVRDRFGLRPGTRVQFEADERGVRLTVQSSTDLKSAVEAGFGLAGYKGPRISEADIDNAGPRGMKRRG